MVWGVLMAVWGDLMAVWGGLGWFGGGLGWFGVSWGGLGCFNGPSFSSLLYEWCRFLTSLFENTHIFAQIFSSESKIEIFI